MPVHIDNFLENLSKIGSLEIDASNITKKEWYDDFANKTRRGDLNV